ncbi:MAG: AmmeMemoRadiSam system radical SAM enzyme [Candidatus Omnitrophota bacterium]
MRKEAMLYEKLEGNKVRCQLCNHHCRIADSKYGLCGVRKNEKGVLYTHVYGEVIASHVDPIEKKPLYHFLPGSSTYSIATAGCNFRCGFCQNWQISQMPKGEARRGGYELKPVEIVREAKKSGCKSISYTYTEPTIFFEYAYDTAKIAKEEGLRNIFVTNGYMTEQALDMIKPYLDACNVDLKAYSDETYKKICRGTLEPVLRSIRYMRKAGIWVEITTLVVPGMNDTDNELKNIGKFIAGLGKEIPWHISRFHPDYKFSDREPTAPAVLERAGSIGAEEGLKYTYLGNVASGGSTYCSNCGKLLIARLGYGVSEDNIENGKCSGCDSIVEGVWK